MIIVLDADRKLVEKIESLGYAEKKHLGEREIKVKVEPKFESLFYDFLINNLEYIQNINYVYVSTELSEEIIENIKQFLKRKRSINKYIKLKGNWLACEIINNREYNILQIISSLRDCLRYIAGCRTLDAKASYTDVIRAFRYMNRKEANNIMHELYAKFFETQNNIINIIRLVGKKIRMKKIANRYYTFTQGGSEGIVLSVDPEKGKALVRFTKLVSENVILNEIPETEFDVSIDHFEVIE